MKSSQPPALAAWFLEHLVPEGKNEVDPFPPGDNLLTCTCRFGIQTGLDPRSVFQSERSCVRTEFSVMTPKACRSSGRTAMTATPTTILHTRHRRRSSVFSGRMMSDLKSNPPAW